MKRSEMHQEINELRRQRALLVRRCVELRKNNAQLDQQDMCAFADAERRWVAEFVLRPGERL